MAERLADHGGHRCSGLALSYALVGSVALPAGAGLPVAQEGHQSLFKLSSPEPSVRAAVDLIVDLVVGKAELRVISERLTWPLQNLRFLASLRNYEVISRRSWMPFVAVHAIGASRRRGRPDS